jgi:hypothetical protein
MGVCSCASFSRRRLFVFLPFFFSPLTRAVVAVTARIREQRRIASSPAAATVTADRRTCNGLVRPIQGSANESFVHVVAVQRDDHRQAEHTGDGVAARQQSNDTSCLNDSCPAVISPVAVSTVVKEAENRPGCEQRRSVEDVSYHIIVVDHWRHITPVCADVDSVLPFVVSGSCPHAEVW